MANKLVENFLQYFFFKKTTKKLMEYHYASPRIAKIKKTYHTKCRQWRGQLDLFHTPALF